MENYILAIILSILGHSASNYQGTPSDYPSTPTRVNPAAITLPNLNLDGTPLDLFRDTVRAAGMAGGIASLESSCSYGQKRPVAITAGTSLQEALNLIANSTQSKWQINDGAVNMFPVSAIPPLLETRIQSFSWDKSAPARDSISKLLALPEIKQKVQQLGLKSGPAEGGSTASCIRNCSEVPKSTPIIETEADVTLLSVLNRIAAAHDRVIWAYLEYRCHNETDYALYVIAE
jgi:hypothetical protein